MTTSPPLRTDVLQYQKTVMKIKNVETGQERWTFGCHWLVTLLVWGISGDSPTCAIKVVEVCYLTTKVKLGTMRVSV